jgi:hypothetical protein
VSEFTEPPAEDDDDDLRPAGYAETEERYHIYRAEPDPADDYPERTDVVTVVTRAPELFEATCNGMAFDSEDFAQRGELFCYLKLDGATAEGMRFPDRDAVENAIEEALRRSDAGWLLGSATGLRYSYVDLAVTDLDRAIEALRLTLQAGGVPRRTWLLFFDTEREDEWVGMWDDSPPPPNWPEE